jgi:hypothetical protein
MRGKGEQQLEVFTYNSPEQCVRRPEIESARDTSRCSQTPSPSHKIAETGGSLSRGDPFSAFFRSLLSIEK